MRADHEAWNQAFLKLFDQKRLGNIQKNSRLFLCKFGILWSYHCVFPCAFYAIRILT